MALKLILNADDFGYDPAVTRGIVQAMREGVVSSTTMVVNSPHSEEAARHAEGLAVGLHLNLVRFTAMCAPLELKEDAVLSERFVKLETRAQLERFEALLGRKPTHIDVHKHAHLRPEILRGLGAVAAEHGLPVRSINERMRQELRERGVETNDVFLGEAGEHAYWTEKRFEAVLGELPADGVVELMCHPGYANSHVTSAYSQQREVELATFLSPRARAALQRRGLLFSPWRH